MAKRTKSQNDIISIDKWYNDALSDYDKALELYNADGDQSEIDRYWEMAANGFWEALVFGHPQAPYSLSCSFNNGKGVRQDDYIAKLFFGVAEALGDEKCQRPTNKQTIPPSMNKAIADLTQLMRDTHAAINIYDDLDGKRLVPQMMIFDKAIKLPHLPNMEITDCLLKKNFKSEAAPQDHNAAHDDYSVMHEEDDVNPSGDQKDDCCCVVS